MGSWNEGTRASRQHERLNYAEEKNVKQGATKENYNLNVYVQFHAILCYANLNANRTVVLVWGVGGAVWYFYC